MPPENDLADVTDEELLAEGEEDETTDDSSEDDSSEEESKKDTGVDENEDDDETKDDEEKSEDEEKEEEDEDYTVDPEHPRPSFKALKEFSPELFKKFPGLRHALGREAEFSRVFSSLDEAKELVEKNGQYKAFENELMQGNPAPILEALKNTSEESATTFALNFLPALDKLDGKLFTRVVSPVLFDVLKAVTAKYDDSKNENKAARILGDILGFGKDLSKAPTKANPDNPEANKLKRQLAQETHQAGENFKEELHDVTVIKLSKIVGKTLDGQEGLTKYVRAKLIKDIIDNTTEAMLQDAEFKKRMTGLFEKAAQSRYPTESKAQILSVYLRHFQTLLPAQRRRALREALGKVKEIPTPGKKEIPSSGGSKGTSGKLKLTEDELKKMSDLDILKA